MKTLSYQADLCVVGGGMAGLCCAIAAARHGIKVVLVQDRPVLGGNASSEIRMWIGGAKGEDNREGGIIEEIFLENFYQNPALKYPIWDSVLYEKAKAEKNLTLLLNTGWNFPKRSFGIGMHRRPECKLAHTLESTYFGTPDNQVQTERLVAFGRAYARAILKYEEGEVQ